MKILKKLVIVAIVLLSCQQTLTAQNTRKEKQAAKIAAVKALIDSSRFIFEADYANPQRGSQRQLTPAYYDLTVSKDSVIAFLPYFGVAYAAPMDPTDRDGGVKFTWTKFDYTVKQLKNGGWDIFIKPKEKNIADMKDVQQVHLSISPLGYASLYVLSSNRDPISFGGDIVQRHK